MTANIYVGGDPNKLDATGYTKGDIIAADASGDLQAIPVGPDGDVLTADSVAAEGVDWQPGGGGGGGSPSNTVVSETSFGQSPTAGVLVTFSRGDHTHGTPASPSVPSASGTVVTETSFGQGSTAGVAATFSRGDHTHGTPASPSVPSPATTVVAETSYGLSSAVGTGSAYAREDHTHGSPTLAAITIAESQVTNLTSDLAARVLTTRTISAGTGLTGGGDLSADRTISMANMSANTLKGNNTGGSAAPADLTVAQVKTLLAYTASDVSAVALSTFTTKGDLVAATASATVARLGVGSNGQVLTADSTQSTGLKWAAAAATAQVMFPYGRPGTVITFTGTARLYNDTSGSLTITAVRSAVGTAPTGASLIVDININGTTIFTTQANRPTIAISGNTSGKVTNMDVTTLAAGDYLTIDVDQVGSTNPGQDLTVAIWASA